MTYVALLRGINVGGKNIIAMSALVKTFERMGFTNVRTFIASGNVIFETAKCDPRKLEQKIEKALTKAHHYDAKVVLRSRDEMQALLKGMPREWSKLDPARRYNVIFLRQAVDSKSILDGVKPEPALESVEYAPGVLYWSAQTSNLAKTAMAKVSASKIYKEITVRTLTTAQKIFALMIALVLLGWYS